MDVLAKPDKVTNLNKEDPPDGKLHLDDPTEEEFFSSSSGGKKSTYYRENLYSTRIEQNDGSAGFLFSSHNSKSRLEIENLNFLEYISKPCSKFTRSDIDQGNRLFPIEY